MIVLLTDMAAFDSSDNNKSPSSMVLLLGDSHIVWLDRFAASPGVARRGADGGRGFALSEHNCVVSYVGRRGATLSRIRTRATRAMRMEGRFDLVVLHIGGNDIDQPTVTPANAVGIGMQTYMFAKELLLSGVKRVVISQVVRRAAWRNCTEEDGAKRVANLNEFLEAACGGTDKIALWKHKGLWRSDRSLF